jgi:hypothetical protein
MIVTYHRIGRIPVLPALAAAGALVVVGGIAVTVLSIVGLIAWSTKALRAVGIVVAKPRLPLAGGDIIDGVVVHRSSTSTLDQ